MLSSGAAQTAAPPGETLLDNEASLLGRKRCTDVSDDPIPRIGPAVEVSSEPFRCKQDELRRMKSIFSAASRRTNRARTSRDAWGAAVR